MNQLIIIMQCDRFNECPQLYYCQQSICYHNSMLSFSLNIVLVAIILPLLTAANNKIGVSSIWLLYLLFIDIMAYLPAQVLVMISGVALAASIVNLIFRFPEKNQNGTGPAINYYIINISIAPLVIGLNLGIRVFKSLPFLFPICVGTLLLIGLIMIFIGHYKSFRADQKIAQGHFKKMLPQRYSKLKSSVQHIQLGAITQVDSSDETNKQNNQTPQPKQYNVNRTLQRSILLQNTKNNIPWKHIVIGILTYLFYQSLCISLHHILVLMGISTTQSVLMTITYLLIVILVVLGLLFLYNFYIKPDKLLEQTVKVNLGVMMNTQTMIKICLLSFVGGFIQGILGIGYCQLILVYMLNGYYRLRQSRATSSILAFIVALTYTLNTVFCEEFNIVDYFSLFGYTLLTTFISQYLISREFFQQSQNHTLKSKLMILTIVVLIIAGTSIFSSFGFLQFRFGSDPYIQWGNLEIC